MIRRRKSPLTEREALIAKGRALGLPAVCCNWKTPTLKRKIKELENATV